MFFNIYVILIALFGLAKIARAQTVVPSTDCTLYPSIHVTEYEVTGTIATYKLSADSTFDPTGLAFIIFLVKPGSSPSTVILGTPYEITFPAPTACGARKCYTLTFTSSTVVTDVIGFLFYRGSPTLIIQFGSFSGGSLVGGITYRTFVIEQSVGLTNHYAQTSTSTCANQQWKHVSLALAGGDPHIRTWGGSQYDYMGSCDLVLLSNARLKDGTMFHVHIRTLLDRWWSFIEKIAIQIGQTTLEFQVEEARFLVDGNPTMDDTVHIGERVSIIKNQYLNSNIDTVHFTFVLTHNGEEFIRINGVDGKKQEMAVVFVHPTEEVYAGSAGMFGEYPSGRMVKRDGITVMSDPDLFGEDWQVQQGEDPQLFVAVEGYPLQTCVYPTEIRNFDSGISLEEATFACQQNIEFFDFCIHDVMSTGDVEVADLYVSDVIDTLGSTFHFEANMACRLAGKFSESCYKEVISSGDLSIAQQFLHVDPIEEDNLQFVGKRLMDIVRSEVIDFVSTDDSVSEQDAKDACKDAVFHFSSCVEEVMVMNNVNIGRVYALEKLH